MNDVDLARTDIDAVRIGPLEDRDRTALLALNQRVSDRSLYRRFFILSRRAADDYVEALLRPASPDHHVLVARTAGLLVGVASYERLDAQAAEIALLIEDRYQHAGIGTRLIEALATAARSNGIRYLVADVLSENSPMIRMVRHLGRPVSVQSQDSTIVMTIELEPAEPVDTV